jgi:pentatricopeptide repeat protein
MAYASLGTVYSNNGNTDLSRENIKKAYELRDRVSDREKFYISSHYEQFYNGNLEKAVQVYELWKQTYPKDARQILLNEGVIYDEIGDLEKALSSYQEAYRLDPDSVLVSSQLMNCYMSHGRFDEAHAILEKLYAKGKDTGEYHSFLYYLAFLQNDPGEMKRQLDWLAGKPGYEGTVLAQEGNQAAYEGQLKKARDLALRAVNSGLRPASSLRVASVQAGVASVEAIFGQMAEARQDAQSATSASNSRDVDVNASMALALAGDTARAQAIHDDLSNRYPQDTLIQNVFLPGLRAAIEYGRGNFAKTTELLQPLTTYELGSAANLDPAYLRGLAYLQLKKGAEAATEFQKLIDHRGVVRTSVTGPLAHLGLARAKVLTGDLAAARTAYQDFFAIWKDAEPDVAIFKAAKAEYASLK